MTEPPRRGPARTAAPAPAPAGRCRRQPGSRCHRDLVRAMRTQHVQPPRPPRHKHWTWMPPSSCRSGESLNPAVAEGESDTDDVGARISLATGTSTRSLRRLRRRLVNSLGVGESSRVRADASMGATAPTALLAISVGTNVLGITGALHSIGKAGSRKSNASAPAGTTASLPTLRVISLGAWPSPTRHVPASIGAQASP